MKDYNDTHCCQICGKEMEWDDNIWINSSFGVCQECYDKIPERINEKIQDFFYDDDVTEYLDSIGAIY